MVILLAPLFFLFISAAGQELFQISTPQTQISHTLCVTVDHNNLNDVSTSILNAEKWLRTYVLSHYPLTNISTIVVSSNPLCDKNEQMFLLAKENIYHSLVRWGLDKKIEVSECFEPSYYTVKKSFTSFNNLRQTSRKLSFIERSSEVSYTAPSDAAATTPLPPLIGAFAPAIQPPAPYFGYHLPPCNPRPNPRRGRGGGAMAAPPVVMPAPPFGRENLWCVAKPSVPAETLQAAIDYACGVGGADCEAIAPSGSCYFPDSIVSHASYAFNSYWQKNKENGGTCGFAGTAMLIASDPSFLNCHFTLV